jgi:hypothetical protein
MQYGALAVSMRSVTGLAAGAPTPNKRATAKDAVLKPGVRGRDMANFLQELKELECAGPKSIVNKH